MSTPHSTARRLATVALAALLGAALAACGDDGGGSSGGDPADTPLAQAIAEDVLAEDETGELTEADARCIAGGIVGDIGEDRLAELGVTADDVGDLDEIEFTDDELGAVADSMIGCVEITELMTAEMTEDLGPDGAACVAERLDGDLLREMMIAGIRDDGGPPPVGIIDAMFDCGVVADMMLARFESEFGAAGAQCLVDELGEQVLRTMVEAGMNGEEPGAETATAAQAAALRCGLAG